MVVYFGALAVPRSAGVLHTWSWIIVAALLIATLPFGVWYYRSRATIRREQGRVCGNCLFPLKDLPAQGVCPECGHRYSIEHTIAC